MEVFLKCDAKELTRKDATRTSVSTKPDIVIAPHPQFDKGKKTHTILFITVGSREFRFEDGDYRVNLFGNESVLPKDEYEERLIIKPVLPKYEEGQKSLESVPVAKPPKKKK